MQNKYTMLTMTRFCNFSLYPILFTPGITVGLESTSYTVSESEEVVEICIKAEGVSSPCNITHPFQVILSSSNETAGIISIIDTLEVICYKT